MTMVIHLLVDLLALDELVHVVLVLVLALAVAVDAAVVHKEKRSFQFHYCCREN